MQKNQVWWRNKRNLFLYHSCNCANKALNRLDLSLFCCDTGSIWGRSIFFPGSVFLPLSKTKTPMCLKKVLLKLLCWLHVRIATSTFIRFAPEDLLGKLSFFAYGFSQKQNTDQQKQLQNKEFYVQMCQCAKNLLDPGRNETWPKKQ